MLIPGSAIIFGSAVTTTVSSIDVTKTLAQATSRAAMARRFSAGLAAALPGIASFFKEFVNCARREVTVGAAASGAAEAAPAACASAEPAAYGAFWKSRLRRRADVYWSSSNVYISSPDRKSVV